MLKKIMVSFYIIFVIIFHRYKINKIKKDAKIKSTAQYKTFIRIFSENSIEAFNPKCFSRCVGSNNDF